MDSEEFRRKVTIRFMLLLRQKWAESGHCKVSVAAQAFHVTLFDRKAATDTWCEAAGHIVARCLKAE